jgi:hypothetical protein
MNPHSYAHLILIKVPKTCNGEKTASSTNAAGKTGYLHACRKLKLDPCLSPCASINSKWIKGLNIKPETLELVQERAGNTLELMGISNEFLNRTGMAQQLRETNDKWGYMKLKRFCTTK